MTRLSKFLTWCSENNIWIDPRIQVIDHQITGLSVYSRKTAAANPIESRVTLVTIPKSAVLSVRSCTMAEMIPHEPYGHGARLALALALYTEILKGLESRWFGYIQSLPRQPVGIALLWGSDVVQLQQQEPGSLSSRDSELARIWAKGTEIEKEGRGEDGRLLLDETRQYYVSVVQPLLSKLSIPNTIYGFIHAYTLVSSRAFLVDAYHGLAMVPIADAFNHEQENHVHLESDYDVCVVCGSLSQCAHDEDSPATDSDTGRKLTNLPNTHSDLDTCDMVANRPIEPGHQIFNTYGESLTNAQLLARYGFALDGNENDIVSWELSELEAPPGMDRRSFVSLVDQVIRIWPRFTGWQESNLVYQPTTTAFLPGNLEGGIGRHRPALCVNGDARISHQFWVYCALYAMAQEVDFLQDVDEVLKFLDRVAIGQIYREKRAGGNEDEGSDAVHRAEGPHLSAASRVLTDSSEDAEIEQVIFGAVRTVVSVCGKRGAKLGLNGEMSSEKMGEEVDRLGDGMERTRYAMVEALSERSILDSCACIWEELGTALSGEK